jgi:hypothetical protein
MLDCYKVKFYLKVFIDLNFQEFEVLLKNIV